MHNEDFNEDFNENEGELDPVDRIRLQEKLNGEIRQSMLYAYRQIEEMGMEAWIRDINLPKERVERILYNMMEWHAAPEREEYEKAAFLKRGLDSLKTKKSK